MSPTAFRFSSLALAVLAGCASESPVTPAPAPVVITTAPQPNSQVVVPQPSGQAVVVPQAGAGSAVVVAPAAAPLRAGFGRVESITALPGVAASGGTTNSVNRRLALRMDDGSLQYLDTPASPLSVGDRVELTSDGKMRFPVP